MKSLLIEKVNEINRPHLLQMWREHWGGETMVVHGQIFRAAELPGFIAFGDETWLGEVTYCIAGLACEVISLESLQEKRGIGSALLAEVEQAAHFAGCRRVFLSTTNDNLHALGWYQRRGYRLAALRPGIVGQSRLLKPTISLVGNNGIPIRDELELEKEL